MPRFPQRCSRLRTLHVLVCIRRGVEHDRIGQHGRDGIQPKRRAVPSSHHLREEHAEWYGERIAEILPCKGQQSWIGRRMAEQLDVAAESPIYLGISGQAFLYFRGDHIDRARTISKPKCDVG